MPSGLDSCFGARSYDHSLERWRELELETGIASEDRLAKTPQGSTKGAHPGGSGKGRSDQRKFCLVLISYSVSAKKILSFLIVLVLPWNFR